MTSFTAFLYESRDNNNSFDQVELVNLVKIFGNYLGIVLKFQ